MISFFCFAIFVPLFASLFRRNTDVFSPARLFLLAWSLTLGLAELKLSKFQIAWTAYSWSMLLLSIGSMLTGMFVVYIVNLGTPVLEIGSIRRLFRTYPVRSEKLYRYTLLLFAAYLLSFLISTLVIGYLPILARNPALARSHWGIFGFGLFIQSFPSIVYLSALYFVLTKTQTSKKLVLAVASFIAFVTYAFLLQRYYIVFALVLAGIFLYYCTSLLRYRNVGILLFILLAIVFGMSLIRTSAVIVNLLYFISRMKYSVKYAWFTEPYMYLVMNTENFAHAVDKLDKFTYGLFSFDFVFALTGLKHMLSDYLHLAEFPYIITSTYNTYTMFFIYYSDFGILGLSVIPFAIGFLFSCAYYKMRRNPTIHTISVYGIFAYVIIFSFFVPIVSFLHFVFNFLIIYVISRIIMFPANNSTPPGQVVRS